MKEEAARRMVEGCILVGKLGVEWYLNGLKNWKDGRLSLKKDENNVYYRKIRIMFTTGNCYFSVWWI